MRRYFFHHEYIEIILYLYSSILTYEQLGKRDSITFSIHNNNSLFHPDIFIKHSFPIEFSVDIPVALLQWHNNSGKSQQFREKILPETSSMKHNNENHPGGLKPGLYCDTNLSIKMLSAICKHLQTQESCVLYFPSQLIRNFLSIKHFPYYVLVCFQYIIFEIITLSYQ